MNLEGGFVGPDLGVVVGAFVMGRVVGLVVVGMGVVAWVVGHITFSSTCASCSTSISPRASYSGG